MDGSYRILKFGLFILYFVIFIKSIKYTLLSVLAICVHELAHIIFLKFSGVNVVNFKVSLLGFKIDLSGKKYINNEFVIYLVGSLSNILIGILCILIRDMLEIKSLDEFIVVNFVIGFVNLIPVFPLDGAIIFKGILLKKIKQSTAGFISIFVSFFILIIMLFLIVGLALMFSFVNITYVVIVVFMILGTYREYKLFMSTFVISRIDCKKGMFLKNRNVKTNIVSVSYDVELLDLIKSYKFKKFLVFYFLDDELKIVGIMNEFNLLECYKKFGNITIKEYYENNLK